MLNIALCEDDPGDLASLSALVERAAAAYAGPARVECFSSGEALLSACRAGRRFGLVLLDVYLDGMDGVSAAAALRKLDPSVPLAFLTVSRDFALQAIGLDALHYLVKPVDEAGLREVFRRLAERGGIRRCLTLTLNREVRRFPLDAVCRVTSARKGMELTLSRDSLWLPRPFREAAEQLLPEPGFVLLSRGCLLNLDYVDRLDYDVFCLLDGTELQASRRERARARAKYHDYLFRRLDREKEGC